MRNATLFTTLAAAALALGLAACDEQQAETESTEPMQQQQGAVPDSGSSSPTAPQGTESPSMTPPAEDPSTSQPGTSGTGQ